MIPKIIHYCWFGNNPLPKLAQKCIESWKRYCPDYEIIEWNEGNFDVKKYTFIREAYEQKKWAFVSDVARLIIVYKYGGIYLDTDVELIKPFGDVVNNNEFFFAIETQSKKGKKDCNPRVNTGLGFGAMPKNKIVRALLDEYLNKHFLRGSGMDTTPCPIKNSRVLEKFGFDKQNKLYRFKGGTIYPNEFFCPKEYMTGVTHFTKNTITIHHYTETWVDKKEKCWMKVFYYLRNYLPDNISSAIASYISYNYGYGIIKGHKKILTKLIYKIGINN